MSGDIICFIIRQQVHMRLACPLKMENISPGGGNTSSVMSSARRYVLNIVLSGMCPQICWRVINENSTLQRNYFRNLALYIVGTPAETVTSSATIKANILAGSINRWGMTCLHPNISPTQGMPHPIAWNIGTMPQTESVADKAMESVMEHARVCRYCERCLYGWLFADTDRGE